MTREEREEELKIAHQMFDNRNLLTELRWQREFFKSGYISKQEKLFNMWIFDECIKALEQVTCEDFIDRAEAMTEIQMNARRYTITKEIGGMREVEWSDYLISIKDALDILIKLPSVQPKAECDNCDYKEWLEGEIEPKPDVLDKIRAEMDDLASHKIHPISFDQSVAVDMCINIIDKYRREG